MKWIVGRCFNFITAEAKRIEAVLEAILKLMFAKVTIIDNDGNNRRYLV